MRSIWTTAPATHATLGSALIRLTAMSVHVNQATQEKCATSTSMNAPATPAAMEGPVKTWLMASSAPVPKASKDTLACLKWMSAAATLVSMGRVGMGSMGTSVIATQAGVALTVTSITMNVTPIPV